MTGERGSQPFTPVDMAIQLQARNEGQPDALPGQLDNTGIETGPVAVEALPAQLAGQGVTRAAKRRFDYEASRRGHAKMLNGK